LPGGEKGAENWSGEVELRGLSAGSYKVADYVNHKDYGTVSGPTARLKLDFANNLLLEVTPEGAATASAKH
jgi:alpha-galactosidase